MKKSLIIRSAFLIVSACLLMFTVLLSSCSDDTDPYVPDPPEAPKFPQTESKFSLGEPEYDGYGYVLTSRNYPKTDGSRMCSALCSAFLQFHLGLTESDVSPLCSYNGKTYASQSFSNNEESGEGWFFNDSVFMYGCPVDLLLTTDVNLSDTVKEAAALDALVIYTHKDNPVDTLTIEQVRDIFSEKITNWSEVGGNDLEIHTYQYSGSSASENLDIMTSLVMKSSEFNGYQMTTETLAGTVDPTTGETGYYDREVPAYYYNDEQSIGFDFRINLRGDSDIKQLQINGASPSDENIKSGAYPLSVTYYGIIHSSDKDKMPGQFLEWILSDEGQKIVSQAGYVPVK